MRSFQTELCLNRAVLLDFTDGTSEQDLELAVSIMQRNHSGDHLSLISRLASLSVRHHSERGAAGVVYLLLFSSERKKYSCSLRY